MNNIVEYFVQTARYGTDIHSTTMKEYPMVIIKSVNVNTGDTDIDKILLGKQLLEWISLTRNLSSNIGQAYNVILRYSTIFTRYEF